MFHKFIRFILPVGIILVLFIATSLALGQAPGGKAVPDGAAMIAPQGKIPGALLQASTIPLSSEASASVDVALGEPGTSFRYVKTVGVTGEPYPADALHLHHPYGIFVDQADSVYVVEEHGWRMLKYTADGTNSLILGHAGFPWHHDDFLSFPKDVAVKSFDDHIWVVINPALKEFDAEGNLVRIFPEVDPWRGGSENDRFEDPRGIAFDSEGKMYIADSGNHRVQVYTFGVDGSPVYDATIGITGEPDADDAHFNWPTKVVVDSLGKLYVLDTGNYRVQRCTFTTVWSCTTFHGTGSPGSALDEISTAFGLGVDSADNVYIADSENQRVKKCTSAGVCSVFATGFEWAASVAVDSSNNVFVTDNHDFTIRKFSSSGASFGKFAGTSGVPYIIDDIRLNRPWGIGTAADGSIYTTEKFGHRLVKLNLAGVQQWTVGEAGIWGDDNDHFDGPEGNPAVDSVGRVYVTDSWNHRVQIFTSAGVYDGTIGVTDETGNDNAHFDYPAGVAISPVNDDIYVVDRWNQRVQVYDRNRVYKATLGVRDEPGADNMHFNEPWGVAVDYVGNIFVADTENFRVQKCTLSGTAYACTTFAGETGVFSNDFGHLRPMAVAVDAAGRVYVTEEWNNRIQVFDPAGAYLTTIGGMWGKNNGQLSGPLGATVNRSGTVYIADHANHRIQVFAPGYPGWKQVNINGFGKRNLVAIPSMGVFEGYLYAGISDWSSNDDLNIYRTADGKIWEPSNTLFYGGVSTLKGFGDYIYAGTWNGEIWRSANGLDWTHVFTSDWGFSHFSTFNNAMYAAVYTDSAITGTIIYKTTDGIDWVPFITNGNGTQSVSGVTSSATFNGLHYFGAADWSDTTGVHIWRTDGNTVTEVVDDGFGDPLNRAPGGMAVLGNYLYVSVGLDDGYEVWRSPNGDSGTWEQVFDGSPDEPGFTHLTGLAALGNELFLVVQNDETGMQIWSTKNGLNWIKVVSSGFGDANNLRTEWSNGIAIFKNSLFVGVINPANGAEVWQKQHTINLPLVVR